MPPDRLDHAGSIVGQHPGVGHCYARAHDWNLWFTLTLGGDSVLGMQRTVSLLAELANADRWMSLPSVRQFKLDARLRFKQEPTGGASAGDHAGRATKQGLRRAPLSARSDILPNIVRALQRDLPAESWPFSCLAAEEDLCESDLLARAKELLEEGILRRYGAILHHVRAGLAYNAMVVWRSDGEDIAWAGARAAEHPAVSHCYERRTAADWPYALYTMIHAPSPEDGNRIIEDLASTIGLRECRALRTTHEYKKQPMRYFTDDIVRWEAVCTSGHRGPT